MKLDFKSLVMFYGLKLLGLISPDKAGDRALKIFTTPTRVPPPIREEEYLTSAQKIVLKSGHPGFVWGVNNTKGNILLVHGWSGRGGQMGMFGQALSQCGYTVYAFDGPAHGQSPESTTDPVQFAQFIINAAEEIGGIEGIVAHSFGAGAALLSVSMGLKVKKIVYIAGPYYYKNITEGFARVMQLSPRVKKAFYAKMEKRVGKSIDSMVVGKFIQGKHIPGLIIQDEQDDVMPIQAAKLLHQDWQESELFITQGLGHRKILHQEAIAKKVCEFFGKE